MLAPGNPITPRQTRGVPGSSFAGELVNPHIVHQHLGGKLGLGIGVAGPVSAHGQVEHQVEALVEGGGEGTFFLEPLLLGLPGLVIDEPGDFPFFPDDREYVEVVREGSGGQGV